MATTLVDQLASTLRARPSKTVGLTTANGSRDTSRTSPGGYTGTQVDRVGTKQTGPAIEGPGIYATDPSVMAAYQQYMSYWNQADEDTAALRRHLADNLATSQKNRAKSLLNNRIGMSDRGLLDSGIALGREGDLNTMYDTTNTQMEDNFNQNLTDIARKKLGLQQAYENSKILAGQKAAQAQAEAQAKAIADQQAAAAHTTEVQQLMAELGLTPTLTPVAAQPTVPAPVYKAPTAVKKPVAKKPVVQPTLKRYGPQ